MDGGPHPLLQDESLVRSLLGALCYGVLLGVVELTMWWARRKGRSV